MAPRNRADKRPSVSFDTTGFGSKRAEERYTESYSHRSLQNEKTVRLADFTDSPVLGWLLDRGWTPILTATGDVYKELVQEFYANLVSEHNEDYAFQTYIRGSSLHFDSIDVCRVLGIWDPVRQDYPPAPNQVNYHGVAQSYVGVPGHGMMATFSSTNLQPTIDY
ncbi:hypothetical protein U1Q18_005185 [Sarracenia purpurea var. burkii]